MVTRAPDDVEMWLALTKKGECTCKDPVIIEGQVVWASELGHYNRNNPGCDNFEPYKEDVPQSCGNCKFWEAQEGMDAYE